MKKVLIILALIFILAICAHLLRIGAQKLYTNAYTAGVLAAQKQFRKDCSNIGFEQNFDNNTSYQIFECADQQSKPIKIQTN